MSYLRVSVENGFLNVSKTVGEKGTHLVFDVDLEEVKALDPAQAAYRIGGTILNLLRLWYPSEFGDWKVPAEFEDKRQVD